MGTRISQQERRVERQIDKDRTWFQKRPHRSYRLRRAIPGEYAIHGIERALSPEPMMDRLKMQADSATGEAAAYRRAEAEDAVVVTLVRREPFGRSRHRFILPRELFDRRHQLNEDDLATWAETGVIDLVALCR